MTLITCPQELQRALAECMGRCSRVFIAAAWMREGFANKELLHCKRPYQAVIGTDFGMTDPTTVERVWKAAGRSDAIRLFPATGRTFHPKLYIFEGKDSWEVLVGSANMTAAAFTENHEAMVHLRLEPDVAADWVAEWQKWWSACDKLTTSLLADYSRQAAKWSAASIVNISKRDDLDVRSAKLPSKAKKGSRIGSPGSSDLPRLSDVLAADFPGYI